MTPALLYCEAKLGVRVGGGECSHLATEALRVGRCRFAWVAVPGSGGDFAWGERVRIGTPANPLSGLAVGDVLQYLNAVGPFGSTVHHTSIVAEVDDCGKPVAVYQQNWNGVRVTMRDAVDLTLTAGRISAYRPQPLVRVNGLWRWTVTNELPTAVSVVQRSGGWSATFTLTPAGTLGAYQVRSGETIRPGMTARGRTVLVRDAAGYAVTAAGIREV